MSIDDYETDLAPTRSSRARAEARYAVVAAEVEEVPEWADLAWRKNGACREHENPLLWIMPRHNNSYAPEARLICASCPVLGFCREWGIQMQEDSGLWGGLARHQRQAEARKRGMPSNRGKPRRDESGDNA